MNSEPADRLLSAINDAISRGLFEISITVVSQGAIISGLVVSPQRWLARQSEVFQSIHNGEAMKLLFDHLGSEHAVDEVLNEALRLAGDDSSYEDRNQVLHLISDLNQSQELGGQQLWRVRLQDVSAWSFGIAR
jgi:hypothetical protein